jgi:hypothetical protein
MTDTELLKAAQAHYDSRFAEIRRLLELRDEAERLGHDTWADEIEERLGGMPLAVDLISHSPRWADQWEILLSTGGPADRVLVLVNGDVESAEYQYQDWFTPWTNPPRQDYDLVRSFAELFAYECPYCELDQRQGR